jgi:hypothetical protein
MNDTNKTKEHKKISELIDRAERMERLCAMSVTKPMERLEVLDQVTKLFELIRKDPGKAYIHLTKAAMHQPDMSREMLVGRVSILSRISGFAMLMALENDDFFNDSMSAVTKDAEIDGNQETDGQS